MKNQVTKLKKQERQAEIKNNRKQELKLEKQITKLTGKPYKGKK